MKTKEKIFDAITNETIIVDRVLTEEEIDEINESKAKKEILEAEKIAIATAKAALLEKLGITEDEAKLLLA